ncbi:FHA domain-containing protein [Aliinostoc sp. HNIBRCY26]|uniref:FHA domain-containing protein n=1 Tax=Aliinostoc sp. HNIBRCY26 TaxID=3418997 RepID=UPI003D046912
MIVCPNCNHSNPDGAVQCEACYTPLPATNNCPNCGATVQSDAAFCGQCGFNLHSSATPAPATVVATAVPDVPVEIPPLVNPDPMLELLQPNALGLDPVANQTPPVVSPLPATEMAAPVTPPPVAPPVTPPPVQAEVTPPPAPVVVPEIPEIPEVLEVPEIPVPTAPPEAVAPPPVLETPVPQPVVTPPPVTPAPQPVVAPPSPARTQLQQITARLVHVQSDREIELPPSLSVIHIGKPNDRIPPDIDVSGFSNSEIVSRVHADIRVEGDAHYIEDVGSSNGTYINNLPLLPGNRHRLRPGDRISLGKGDLVTFLFKLV